MVGVVGADDRGNHRGGAALLHLDRRGVGVERAGLEQTLEGVGDDLRGNVVEVGFDDRDDVGVGAVIGVADDQAKYVGKLRVAGAGTVSGGRDLHGRKLAVTGSGVGEDQGAGGGEQLGAVGGGEDGCVRRLEYVQGGHARDRDFAVPGVDGAAAGVHRGDDDVGCAEPFEPGGRADDVEDGVDGADFVEVDFVDGAAVGAGFGLGEIAEHGDGAVADRSGEGAGFDDAGDGGKVAVVLFGTDLEVDVGGGDRPASDLFDLHRVGVERQLSQLGFEFAGGPAGIDERAKEHVAGGAGEGVEEGDLHALSRAPRQI